MPERIALVSFKFPPYEQVGARRWTKLAKYLAIQGVELDVFTTYWGAGAAGISDIDHTNIHVHRIPCFGLHRLWYARFDRSTLFGRIGWFVERVLTRYVRGWALFEEARFWRRSAKEIRRTLADRDIDTLIATGAPFMAVWWAAQVKKQRPDIRFVVDYRDPWTPSAPPASKRAARQLRMEDDVLAQADLVITVSEGLAEMLRERALTCPVAVLRNGCDPQEVRREARPTEREPVILHAGNVYVGRERPLEVLLEVIRDKGDEFPELRFVFYGGFPAHLKRSYADLIGSGVLSVRDRIAPEDLMVEIGSAFACLQFNAAESPFALSTKIYEYACAGRPTLSLNYGGEIEQLITEHSLGWSVNAETADAIRAGLLTVLQAWRSNPDMAIDSQATRQFSYPILAERLITLLDTNPGADT